MRWESPGRASYEQLADAGEEVPSSKTVQGSQDHHGLGAEHEELILRASLACLFCDGLSPQRPLFAHAANRSQREPPIECPVQAT